VNPRFVFCPDGYEYLYSLATRRAAVRLLTEVAKAVERDLDTWAQSGVPAPTPSDPPRGIVVRQALGLFGELLQVSTMRVRVLCYSEQSLDRYWRFTPIPADFSDPHKGPLPGNRPHEDAMIGLVRYWEQVLAPWFAADAACNYRGLTDLLHPESRADVGVQAALPNEHPWHVLPAWGPGTESLGRRPT
jgi:hypothetical protein